MSGRTWAENAKPTAEQFADWYASLPRAERIERAETLLDAMDRADVCFLMDHERQVDRMEAAEAALARVRALAGEWEHRYDAGDHMLGLADGAGYYDLLADELRAALAGDDEAGMVRMQDSINRMLGRIAAQEPQNRDLPASGVESDQRDHRDDEGRPGARDGGSDV